MTRAQSVVLSALSALTLGLTACAGSSLREELVNTRDDLVRPDGAVRILQRWHTSPPRPPVPVPCEKVMALAREALAKAKLQRDRSKLSFEQINTAYKLAERAVDCNPDDPEAWELRAAGEELRENEKFAGRYRIKAQELRAQIARQQDRAYTALLRDPERQMIDLSDKIKAAREASDPDKVAHALVARSRAHEALDHQDLALADLHTAVAEPTHFPSTFLRARAEYFKKRGMAELAAIDEQQAAASDPQELQRLAAGFRQTAEAAQLVRNVLQQRAAEAKAKAQAREAFFESPPQVVTPQKEREQAILANLKVEALDRCGYRMGPILTGPAGDSGPKATVFIRVDRGTHLPVDLETVQVGLPVEISQELLTQVEQRGVKIGMKLDLPFFNWLVREHSADFRGEQAFAGWGGQPIAWPKFPWDAIFGCYWENWTDAAPAGKTLSGLITLLRTGRLPEIQALVREYLDSANFAAQATPVNAAPARPLVPRVDQEHLNKEVTP